MAVSNSLTPEATKKPKISEVLSSEAYRKMINNTLRDPKRANRFVASVISAVSASPALQGCDAQSIVSCALLGEGLELSPSPQLGQFYMVPYKDKKRDITVAQFQLGYKGYIQLAIRSGCYKKLNVLAIKQGELVKFDPLEEEIVVNLIEDDAIREATPTIGYYVMFEHHSGYKKAIYWSKEKMLAHADKYSQAFSREAVKAQDPRYNKVSFADFEAGKVSERDMWLYSSFWYKDFDGMAYKTMLRQLISKWGPMSVEIQTAMDKDMAAINGDGTVAYVDNSDDYIPAIGTSESVVIDEATGEVIEDTPEAPPASTGDNDAMAGFFGEG